MRAGVSNWLRTRMIAGLLVILPLALTLLVLRLVFTTLDNLLQPYVVAALGRRIPGLGLLAGVAVILAAGAIGSNVFGSRVIGRVDRLLQRVPLARTVYGSVKELSTSILGKHGLALTQVVLIEWPRPGLHAIGFVTGGSRDGDPTGLIHVFVPATPNPTAGMVVITRAGQVRPLHLTPEEALRFIVSGGIVATPEAVTEAIAAPAASGR